MQFWVRGASSQFDGKRCAAPSPPSRGWQCLAPVCITLWRSWAGQASVQMIPLCSFVQVDQRGWHKANVPASAFAASFGEAFDEIALLAGPQGAELLLDEVVVASTAAPPSSLAFARPPLDE